MGAVVCCLTMRRQRQRNENGSSHSSAAAECKYSNRREHMTMKSSELGVGGLRKVEWRTLEECLQNSPNLNACPCCIPGGEVQMFKNLPRKVHPSSSPESEDTSPEFFTPRRSFSSGRSGKIDETEEEDSASLTPSSSSRSASGKLRKKVSFRFPGEADIFVYY